MDVANVLLLPVGCSCFSILFAPSSQFVRSNNIPETAVRVYRRYLMVSNDRVSAKERTEKPFRLEQT